MKKQWANWAYDIYIYFFVGNLFIQCCRSFSLYHPPHPIYSAQHRWKHENMGPRSKITGLLRHHVFTRQQLLGATAIDGRLSLWINKQTGVDLHKFMAKPVHNESCHMTWFSTTVFQFISSVKRLVLSSAPLLKQNGGGIKHLPLSPPHCRFS